MNKKHHSRRLILLLLLLLVVVTILAALFFVKPSKNIIMSEDYFSTNETKLVIHSERFLDGFGNIEYYAVYLHENNNITGVYNYYVLQDENQSLEEYDSICTALKSNNADKILDIERIGKYIKVAIDIDDYTDLKFSDLESMGM